MNKIAEHTANYLLQIKAIKLKPSNPFTWASGWRSPIYCDNRKTLSYPEVRNYIRDAFVSKIKEHFSGVEVIAGVATGGIAIGALVAQELDLPFIYVRSSAKAHGMTNLVEGAYEKGQKVVVIEDLISTGGSSLKAVSGLREAEMDVMGMLAIFTYGFETALQNFEKAGCKLYTLSDYHTLIEEAVSSNYVSASDIERLSVLLKNPANW